MIGKQIRRCNILFFITSFEIRWNENQIHLKLIKILNYKFVYIYCKSEFEIFQERTCDE